MDCEAWDPLVSAEMGSSGDCGHQGRWDGVIVTSGGDDNTIAISDSDVGQLYCPRPASNSASL